MKVIENKVEIPAKVYTEKVYVAEDGKEFDNKDACERYEYLIKVNKHPVFKSAIETSTYPDFYFANLYYISSKDDYEFFVNVKGFPSGSPYFKSDYMKYGNGWYIYYVLDGGDYADEYFLLNLNNYITEVEKEFNEWKEEINGKISGVNK